MNGPGPDLTSHAEPTARGRVPWIALVALVALALGLGTAALQWRKPGPAGGVAPGDVAAPSDTGEDVIRQALEQTASGVDSTALKRGWVNDVRGLDVSDLLPDEVETLVRFTNARDCTCGCGFTLAACRAWDLTCPVSLPRVEALRDSIRDARAPARGRS